MIPINLFLLIFSIQTLPDNQNKACYIDLGLAIARKTDGHMGKWLLDFSMMFFFSIPCKIHVYKVLFVVILFQNNALKQT